MSGCMYECMYVCYVRVHKVHMYVYMNLPGTVVYVLRTTVLHVVQVVQVQYRVPGILV